MKIRKININGFGKFENRQFILNPGMNIFYGANESGKSTLQSFIRGMLYGMKGGKRTKDGVLPPVRQYKPWTAKAYGGSLEYELDNGSIYTITRNFDKNTVNVYDEYSNNITGSFPAGKEEGAKFAEQHLGLTESCFERTVFIGQMQSAINSEGKKVIAERLTNIKQTGDEEVSFRKAINALKEAQMEYVGTDRTTTRPLNIINSRLQLAMEEEKEYIRLHKSCMDMFAELELLYDKETELKIRLNELNRLKSGLVKKLETKKLENTCGILKRCYESLAEIEKEIGLKQNELEIAASKLKKYEAYKNFSRSDMDEMIADYANYRVLRRELDKHQAGIDEIEDRIREIRDELDGNRFFSGNSLDKMDEVIHEVLQYRGEPAASDTGAKPRTGFRKYAALAGVAIGLVILILSFLTDPFNPAITAAGLAVLLAAGMLFISADKGGTAGGEITEQQTGRKMKYRENTELLNAWMEQAGVDNIHDLIRLKNIFEEKIKRLNDLKTNRDKLSESKNITENSIREFESRILDRLNAVNLLTGSDFGEEDIQNWKQGLENFSMLFQKIKELETVLSLLNQKKESLYRESSVAAGYDINLLAELEKEIQAKSSELEKAKSELGGETYNSEYSGPDEIELDIRQLSEELDRVRLTVNTLKTRLENIPDGEMIQKAHEKVCMLKEERDRKVLLGKALEIAMEVLTEASVDIQRNYSPYLNEAMGEIMGRITDGKYRDIMADDSLKLNIQTPDTADMVNPEQLSQGTADQVYFALRLATVKLIEKDGETLPLFLDDPFVQYDEERTKNALGLLYDESYIRQIILFTCKKREVELAQKIFSGRDINIINL